MNFFDPIYNHSDPSCCYSGGAIIGAYKLVEDAKQNPPPMEARRRYEETDAARVAAQVAVPY